LQDVASVGIGLGPEYRHEALFVNELEKSGEKL
jgi:hypothetical protein